MAHTITLIPGDGIGPEVADATRRILEASGVALVQPVHETAWNTRELVIRDDQGHTLYFGQPLQR